MQQMPSCSVTTSASIQRRPPAPKATLPMSSNVCTRSPREQRTPLSRASTSIEYVPWAATSANRPRAVQIPAVAKASGKARQPAPRLPLIIFISASALLIGSGVRTLSKTDVEERSRALNVCVRRTDRDVSTSSASTSSRFSLESMLTDMASLIASGRPSGVERRSANERSERQGGMGVCVGRSSADMDWEVSLAPRCVGCSRKRRVAAADRPWAPSVSRALSPPCAFSKSARASTAILDICLAECTRFCRVSDKHRRTAQQLDTL